MSMRMFPEKTSCSQQLSEDSLWIWVVPSSWLDTWMEWKEGENCSLSFSHPEWMHLLLLLDIRLHPGSSSLDSDLRIRGSGGALGGSSIEPSVSNWGLLHQSLLFWGFHLLELSCYWYLWPFKLHTAIIKLSGLCNHVSQSDKPSPILKYMLLVLFLWRMLTNTRT